MSGWGEAEEGRCLRSRCVRASGLSEKGAVRVDSVWRLGSGWNTMRKVIKEEFSDQGGGGGVAPGEKVIMLGGDATDRGGWGFGTYNNDNDNEQFI